MLRKKLSVFFLFGILWLHAQKNQQVPLKTDSLKAKRKNRVLIAPLVGNSLETNWQFGFASAYIFRTNRSDTNLRASTAPIGFLYTLNNQILLNFGTNIYFPKDKYNFRMDNSYTKFPEFFWGIGNDKIDSKKFELYSFSQYSIVPQLHRSVFDHLFIGLGLEFQRVFDIFYKKSAPNDTSLFVLDKVRGVIDKSTYQVLGASFYITYDSRNNAYAPDKGYYLRLKFSEFNTFTISDYTFNYLDIDGRAFIRVYKKQILGLQYASLFNFGAVPYRNYSQLGSSFIMRGYYQGRFRDLHFVGAQAEYRFHLLWKLGAVVFAGTGQVFGNFSSASYEKFKISLGSGLRFELLQKEKLNLRFDVAWGNHDQFNYYLTVGESF